jgi:hypothetical protein
MAFQEGTRHTDYQVADGMTAGEGEDLFVRGELSLRCVGLPWLRELKHTRQCKRV